MSDAGRAASLGRIRFGPARIVLDGPSPGRPVFFEHTVRPGPARPALVFQPYGPARPGPNFSGRAGPARV